MNRRLALSVLAFAAGLRAQNAQGQVADADLTELSLEQLMQVPVDVGNRHAESMAQTAASVFVLTAPEIRRSGMRSVAELLRLVPGLIIAQDIPGAYGFSSRLGELEYSGMLVLLDGQRLYTTLLRREYFQAIDLPIDIIERIEVVKGPGGARWGDKATQGVINIVTKKADKLDGGRVSGLVGNEDRLLGTFRYGLATGEATSLYVFGKAATRDGGFPDTTGDRWDNRNLGGRLDSKLGDGVDLTVDGDMHFSYTGDSYEIQPGYTSDNTILGGHLKSTLHVDHDAEQWTEARVAWDGYDQRIIDTDSGSPAYHLRFREQLEEASLQHSMALAPGHQVTIGAGVRHLGVRRHENVGDTSAAYDVLRSDLFVDWDWQLCEHVKATIGGNLGYQAGYRSTGAEAQPDLRLAWTPTPEFTVWSALSANREPDQKFADSGITVHRRSSRLRALELGMRRRFGEMFLLQADGFSYWIDHQENDTTTDPGSGATLYVTEGKTEAFGGEVTASWNPTEGTRLTTWVATTQGQSHGIDPASYWTLETSAPHTRGGMTFGFNPWPGIEVDGNLLYTEKHYTVGSWWRLDLRLGWRPSDGTSVDLVGQNLTQPHHDEYFYQEAAQRGFYVMVTQRF